MSPVVQSVEEIRDNSKVVGIRVQTDVNGARATYHIFSLPEDGSYVGYLRRISFQGRFGIIIEKDNGEVTFYMGDASSMSFGRKAASSGSSEATSANIVFRPGEEPAIASNGPVTVSAIDTTVGSIDQLIFAADFSLESDPSKSHKVAIEDDVVVNLTKGSWIAFPNFDFGNGANSFSAIASNDTEEPKTLELRKLAPDGPLIGTVQIDPTSSSDSFEVFSTDALDRVNGIVDLYLVFPDGGFELVNFYFEGGIGGIGSVDLAVIEDSYIRGGSNADANYGDQDRLAFKDTGNAAFDRITYLKFDLDEIPGTDILSAELYLSGRVAEGDGDVPVNIYSINNDSWTEATLTWISENSHASDDTNIIAPDAVLEGSITFLRSCNSIQYLDITDAVRENLEDGKLSFAVTDENNYNQQTFIDSRESTGLPATIHVLYKFVPSEVGTLINAGAYDQESNLGSKNTVSPSDGAIAFARDGGWVKYSGFNFGQGASRVSLTANAASAQAGTVEFRLGSPDGELIAQVAIDPSPGSGNTFHSYAAALISSPTGLQDLYLIFVNKSQKRYSIGSFLFE